MDNESIAAAAVGIKQAQTSHQIAIAALKNNAQVQKTMVDSIASSASRVGPVQNAGQAVMQSGRLLDSLA